MAAYDEVDMLLLINRVKAHPEIWDINCEDHKDKKKKDAAWEEIAKNIVPNFDERDESEKNEIVKKFVTKWRNIRDAYSRSEKKRSRSGQRIAKVRKYIYAKQLSFLQTSINLVASEPTTSKENDGNTFLLENPEEESSEEAQPLPSTSLSTPKQRKKNLENSFLRYLNQPNTKPPDEDQSFFDSILPSVRKLNEDQKLEFRTEVLIILKNIKRGIASQPYPQSLHHYHPVTHLAQYTQPTSYTPPESFRRHSPPRLSASVGSDVSQSSSSPIETKPIQNVDIFPNSP